MRTRNTRLKTKRKFTNLSSRTVTIYCIQTKLEKKIKLSTIPDGKLQIWNKLLSERVTPSTCKR
ncbi:hypothetical protein C0J52_12402 [Blattella germanica]|nr:hypothetical protein C0J52_12402 [Blattella germanica]